jgi:hypothetical protein
MAKTIDSTTKKRRKIRPFFNHPDCERLEAVI